jgi:hypothetical protein
MIKYKTKPGLKGEETWLGMSFELWWGDYHGKVSLHMEYPVPGSCYIRESLKIKMERTCSDMANRISGNDDSIASGDLLILDNSRRKFVLYWSIG